MYIYILTIKKNESILRKLSQEGSYVTREEGLWRKLFLDNYHLWELNIFYFYDISTDKTYSNDNL